MTKNSVEIVCKHRNSNEIDIINLTITFINKEFNLLRLKEYENRYFICDQRYDQISSVVEALFIQATNEQFPLNITNTKFFVYSLHMPQPELEMIENESDEETSAASHWILPSREFHNNWNNLYFETGLKENLLRFVETSIIFSNKGINTNVITCNRLMLLHGPPGTGKTSLCKAIAQKISIRMKDIFKFTHLIEINSHSLFSKWFSESGKLVMKLFQKIRDVVENKSHLVCVLIDEVESIAYARTSCSNDPTDSIRVVNAVLTQLDQIRQYPNVFVFTTSNLSSSIDSAFLDRVDIKQYIGFPDTDGIARLYIAMLQELIDVGLITDRANDLNLIKNAVTCDLYAHFEDLLSVSGGLSGRTLKKIPFLAFTSNDQLNMQSGIMECLITMKTAVEKHTNIA